MFKTAQLHSFHTLARPCSKFSKPGFSSMWTKNFKLCKLDLEKAEEPEIKLSTSFGSSKKQESSRKTFTSASLTTLKTLTVWITIKCGKFLLRDVNTRPLYLSPQKRVCRSRSKQQLEPDMEQWTGSKLREEYVKAVYCLPAHLTYIQSASCEILGWMKLKLELRLSGEISITSYIQVIQPLYITIVV